MESGVSLVLQLPSPEATTALASRLAPALGAGDVLLLEGPLGAGKSHLARALIHALQAPHGPVEEVPSPTFTLVQTYEAGPLEIWHADLYRLSAPEEVFELGLSDAFSEALVLIEWPDRLGELQPARHLRLRLEPGAGPDARIATFTPAGGGWERIMTALEETAHGG